MKNPLLIQPDIKYEKSYLEALEEVKGDNLPDDTQLMTPREGESFAQFTQRLHSERKGIDLQKDYVPATTLWLVDNDEFIGRLQIRHILGTENLQKLHGHIGYYIRPSKRKQGYGSKILELGLKETKKLGIEKALITCNVDNVGSKKIIEKHGGVFEGEIEDTDKNTIKRRYWITV